MQFTKEEIKVAVYSVLVDTDGKSKTYGADDLPLAVNIFKAFNVCTNDDEVRSYKDGGVELSTSMKAFLLERLNREWGVGDGQYVLTLKEKLEAA
jgi:hypothetical protein